MVALRNDVIFLNPGRGLYLYWLYSANICISVVLTNVSGSLCIYQTSQTIGTVTVGLGRRVLNNETSVNQVKFTGNPYLSKDLNNIMFKILIIHNHRSWAENLLILKTHTYYHGISDDINI